MKYIFYAFLFLLVSCSGSKKSYLERTDSDDAVFDAIKALKKKSSDTAASHALPVLYTAAQQRHIRKIGALSENKELNRWDKLIDEYSVLQNMHDAIIDADAAYSAVTPVNYMQTIYDLKQRAAEDYYNAAADLLADGSRENAKKAYNAFKKSDKFVPGYKDAKSKMDEAYQSAIVNVQINPIQDNSFFFNTGNWGNYGYNYSNEYFQQTLVRELGGKNSSRYPARFYTDWEARRDNIQPDWMIDLSLRNINMPRPSATRYSNSRSKQVETGRDTSGKPVYQTVYATINITRQSFEARAEMEVFISDAVTHKTIDRRSFTEYYNWQEEYGSYSGDSRALDANDWNLINNTRFSEPRREDVLNELYRKLYPQVKNRIVYAVDW